MERIGIDLAMTTTDRKLIKSDSCERLFRVRKVKTSGDMCRRTKSGMVVLLSCVQMAVTIGYQGWSGIFALPYRIQAKENVCHLAAKKQQTPDYC